MRALRQRRQERKKGSKGMRADREAVIAVAGGLCERCGAPVPEGAGYIDHVIPLARGGAHDRSNWGFCALRAT